MSAPEEPAVPPGTQAPPPTFAPGRGPRRMAPQLRRQHLIDVAAHLYAERPFDQVCVDDITEAAGVSRALFYRYFAGPREIFVASTQAVVDGLIAKFTGVPYGLPLLEQTHISLSAFLSFAESWRASFVALKRNTSVQASSGAETIMDQLRTAAVDEMLLRLRVSEPTGMFLLTLQNWIHIVEDTTLAWLTGAGIEREGLEDWLIGQLVATSLVTAERDEQTAIALAAALDGETATLAP